MADRRFTDVELERLLAGELTRERLDAKATDADRARLAELEIEHAAFLATVDVDAEVRRIQQRVARVEPQPKRAGWLRWLAPAGALAAAAAVVLVLVNRRSPPASGPPTDDDLQTKGDGVSLVIHAANGSASQRLATGDTVAPGARIRFEAQGTVAGYIAIVGIDGAGTTTVYYPYNGSAPAVLGRRDRMLPGAIQLDATPGDERFFAVFSTATFSVEAATAALRTGASLPAGVLSSQVVLHKR